MKAHCLLDSGSEGVLLTPEFTRAMGIKTFALEKPIALQLACIGSRSMINYGTCATIKIGHKVVEEYFDITNVEHYDVILGTPFLRKMGIVLDFRSPGMARIGNEVIPNGKVFFDELRTPRLILPQRAILYRAAVLPWTGNEARRVDHRRAHPKIPLAPARGSILILG